jgi:hypothetical protein
VGTILPIKNPGSWQKKLDAMLDGPVLSDVIVAAAQQEVEAGSHDRLRIWKDSRAADLRLHSCAQ